ncbi:hypothetical protein ACWIUA_12220 [Ursidibacter sp. B-7004-1]
MFNFLQTIVLARVCKLAPSGAGHSRINSPQGDFIGKGNTEFDSLRLPNKDGRMIDRKTDSEYKIFSNLADQLGSNTQAKG